MPFWCVLYAFLLYFTFNVGSVEVRVCGFQLRSQCKEGNSGKETIICQTRSDAKPWYVKPRLQIELKHTNKTLS